MICIDFYLGKRGNVQGTTLADVLTFTKGQMEADHDYIQWMFPSNEMSQMNGDAPVLSEAEAVAFQDSEELKDKMEVSFDKFLWFLDLKREGNDIVKVKDELWWLKNFNHNMLRITRVLKSLRLTGLGHLAGAFFIFLKKNRNKVSDNTFKFWHEAANDPLWTV